MRAFAVSVCTLVLVGCAGSQQGHGPVDASSGAGRSDAGRSDGSLSDAGRSDAGLPDAGLSDASLSDAVVGAGTGLPLDRFAAEVGAAECDALVTCGEQHTFFWAWSPDGTRDCVGATDIGTSPPGGGIAAQAFARHDMVGCAARYTENAVSTFWYEMAGVADGTEHYDPLAAEACVRDLRECVGVADSLEWTPPSSCASVFVPNLGTQPLGAACRSATDCAGDAVCRYQAPSSGVCAERVPLGGDCLPECGQRCDRLTVCVGAQCRAVSRTGGAVAGEPCGWLAGAARSCAPGFTCTGSQECVRRPGLGEPCAFEEPLHRPIPGDGDVVCGADGVEHPLVVRSLGEPCADQSADLSDPRGICNPVSLLVCGPDHTCIDGRLAHGDACHELGHWWVRDGCPTDCACEPDGHSGSACITGVTPPSLLPNGAACTSAEQCATQFCNESSVCGAQPYAIPSYCS